jgi:shikimate 5-dehydrogenase
MNPALQPATRPTIYFIGVTTGRSSIMSVFPRWAEHLGLGDCAIVGVDLPLHADRAAYREVVTFIRDDPRSLGALVTTHKLDLFAACRDLFDEVDVYATLMKEVSSISKAGGRLVCHAKDPISSGLALRAFLPPEHWVRTGAEALLMGAGGSTLAIMSHLVKPEQGQNRPGRIVVTNRSTPRLAQVGDLARALQTDVPVVCVHAPSAIGNDAELARLPPGSLVVNGTGLGKDAPGSPLTAAARFPMGGIAWDLNYRGQLVFLDQARAQQARAQLQIEDGWVYFLHGWTQVIAEVFHLAIPTQGPAFERLSEIAGASRR